MSILVYALAPFAAIGLVTTVRWFYRTRNYGSSIGQLLKPRGYGSLNGH